MKGKGKIVTRSWIEKCYELKKYLPWRRYALDTNDIGQPESDEELCDEATRPRRDSSKDDVAMLEDSKLTALADQNDVEMNPDALSGIDTEDELQRVAEGKLSVVLPCFFLDILLFAFRKQNEESQTKDYSKDEIARYIRS